MRYNLEYYLECFSQNSSFKVETFRQTQQKALEIWKTESWETSYSKGPNRRGGPNKRALWKIANCILREVVQIRELVGKLRLYRYGLE